MLGEHGSRRIDDEGVGVNLADEKKNMNSQSVTPGPEELRFFTYRDNVAGKRLNKGGSYRDDVRDARVEEHGSDLFAVTRIHEHELNFGAASSG